MNKDEQIHRLRQEVAELREAGQKYRSLVEQSLVGIYIIEGGKYRYVNPRFAQMFGYARAEIENRKAPRDLTAPEDRPIVNANIKKRLDGEIPSMRYSYRGLRKDGGLIDVEVHGTRIEMDGKPALIGVILDITERKLTEQLFKERDHSIRTAYADALGAVTGGRLVILTVDEMAVVLGEPVTEASEVRSYRDLHRARAMLNEASGKRFFDTKVVESLVLASNEAITNAVKHAGAGKFQLFARNSTLQVLVTDKGPGIDFSVLPRATLASGFSTKQSLGVGFSIMLEACDKVIVATQPGDTKILLEMSEEETTTDLLGEVIYEAE